MDDYLKCQIAKNESALLAGEIQLTSPAFLSLNQKDCGTILLSLDHSRVILSCHSQLSL
jgi:hypothetical protein